MMKSVFMSFYVTRYCIEHSSCVCRNCSVRLELERGKGSGRGALAAMLSLPPGQRVAQTWRYLTPNSRRQGKSTAIPRSC
jgi:hypothetical protein